MLSQTRKKQRQFQQILMKKSSLENAKCLCLLAFSLITIALLTAVSIYCYLIKYRAK